MGPSCRTERHRSRRDRTGPGLMARVLMNGGSLREVAQSGAEPSGAGSP
jgi:hypothetical protein